MKIIINKKFSRYYCLMVGLFIIFALLASLILISTASNGGEENEIELGCHPYGEPCIPYLKVDITNNKADSCTDKVKWEIQKNCEGSYKDVSDTCIEGNGEVTINSGETKPVKCTSEEIPLRFTGTHCVKISWCGKTEKFSYGELARALSTTEDEIPDKIRVLITSTNEIKEVDFRNYVKDVLPNEVYAGSWEMDALKANAMAAKTYAWYWTIHEKYPGKGYDVVDTAADQVYKEGSHHPRTDQAVDETWDNVMMRNGEIFQAQYVAGTPGKPEPIWNGKLYSGRLSQWGSQYWAEIGKDWQWILHYYYDPIELSSDVTTTTTTTTTITTIAMESKCRKCGRGIFNLCDENECNSLGRCWWQQRNFLNFFNYCWFCDEGDHKVTKCEDYTREYNCIGDNCKVGNPECKWDGEKCVNATLLPNSIAALGDSITQAYGTGFTPGERPRHSWSTGDSAEDIINSHYERILTLNSRIRGKNYNNAVSGSKVRDIYAQAQKAIAQKPEYITILIGSNDACAHSLGGMTKPEVFENQFRRAMDLLAKKLPDTKILVVGIPDIYQLYDIGIKKKCTFIWYLAKICQALTNPKNTEADRLIFRQRVIEYNEILKKVTSEYGQKYIPSAFNYQFKEEDLSWDCFHPSLEGQMKLAERTWNDGYFA